MRRMLAVGAVLPAALMAVGVPAALRFRRHTQMKLWPMRPDLSAADFVRLLRAAPGRDGRLLRVFTTRRTVSLQ